MDGTNLGVDLLVVADEGLKLYRNQYAGQYQRDAGPWDEAPPGSTALCDDFDNDGLADVVWLNPSRSQAAYGLSNRRADVPLTLTKIDASAAIDLDNDGWLDIVASGLVNDAFRVEIAINRRGAWEAYAPEFSWPLQSTGSVAALLDLDVDGDGDTDLLGIDDAGRLAKLVNEGGDKQRQIKLALHSFVGHPSSIGTRVQVRRKDHVVTRFTRRELPIEIGMAHYDTADAIQTLWMNGVVNNEIDVPFTSKPLQISVIEFVRTSSCPFLYAQSGETWEFVTDILGSAPLNVAMARGVAMPGHPDELVVVGDCERYLSPRDKVALRITSELREAIYVDELRALVVEHSQDIEVFSKDRTSQAPPPVLPTDKQGRSIDWQSTFVAATAPRLLRAAMGSDNVDRTEALRFRDGEIAEPAIAIAYPVVGHTKPLSIELDFGPLDANEPLLLACTGWFRFGNSSTNIAASQRSDLAGIWPRLEALDGTGRWQMADEALGFPTGNLKTIVCDLRGKLPPKGAQRLRVTTSFDVKWDQFALYKKVSAEGLLVDVKTPSSARLEWHGFADLRVRRPNHPAVPDPSKISDQPPWITTLEGWCTAGWRRDAPARRRQGGGRLAPTGHSQCGGRPHR